jgi:hypothetical protein
MLSFLLLLSVAISPAQASGGADGARETVTGRLVVRAGASFLARGTGEVPLTSGSPQMADTLVDERIAGRELKLAGRTLSDGRFDVEDLWVVREAKLLRLVYFCETCNITTFGPGICDCCREETLPVEIPLNDPRVHNPGSQEPPRGA